MNANDPKPFDPQALDRGSAKLNPAPQQAYEITLTIDNAPGPFAVVEGIAQFDVTNEGECGYIDPFAGVPHRITSSEPFELNKISENEYRGTLYLDYMQDDAYYDRAVCHWEFTQARARLRATESPDDTRFLPRLDRDELLAQQSRTTYFWRGGYPRDEMANYPDSGYRTPERFKPEIRNDLFSITLSARKVTP
ncbi:hypothetical protein EBB59_06240 [Lysobacter pythonis]|uniref:Uncharacterized protein n=1 Tax=Solilutibacter pythonis TaxID=2483112 RepID=A0A3M2HY07_9GAMM|nr:hypothetical protein [Lysobacter pythonis]RMH93135.1 hypothetical protein EBB59_06240 [Lysobacter pythonis]